MYVVPLLFELFHVIPVSAVGPGHGDLHKQIRQADVPHGVKKTAGRHAKGAGQVGISGPGWPQDDEIVCFLEAVSYTHLWRFQRHD